MLEGNNILIFMGIIVLLVIVATVIAVVSSVAGAAAAIVDDEDGEENAWIFAELYKIKHIEKVLRKRSTQHTLERENGSSAERPFKEGVVEGSFWTGELKV